MKLEDLIPFMGHSSIYLPFDDFLTSHGIKWRPSLKRNLDYTYFIKGDGLAIEFTISANRDGISKKSEGTFIFESIEAMLRDNGNGNGNGNGIYDGPIPFGISSSDNRFDVEQKIGPPRRKNEESDNYFIDDLVWIFAFENSEANANLEFIQIYLPSDGWRKHGLC